MTAGNHLARAVAFGFAACLMWFLLSGVRMPRSWREGLAEIGGIVLTILLCAIILSDWLPKRR